MVDLLIDAGNSYCKVALAHGGRIGKPLRLRLEDSLAPLESLVEGQGMQRVGICRVGRSGDRVISWASRRARTVCEVNGGMPLPFRNGYRPPESLGADRLCGVAGAQALHPDREVIIVDAGSALTCDYLDASGEYRGGTISPGLAMRFASLHIGTAQLPGIADEGGETPTLGLNTHDAIVAGVEGGIMAEIAAFVRKIRTFAPDALLLLTGGDGPFVSKRLPMDHALLPALVMRGIQVLLEYNDAEKR